MLNIFRRIRQKLVDSGSVHRYLLYALGEILLVVIGILIALQINNWNEDRKNHRLSEIYIERLISDIRSDSTQIADYHKLAMFKYEIGKKVYELYEGKDDVFETPLEAMVAINMTGSTNLPDMRNNTYEDMISTGSIQYITNQQLTDDLLIYYGSRRDLYIWFDEYIDRAWRGYLPEAIDLQPLDLLEGILRYDRTRNQVIDLKEYVAALEFNENEANEIIDKLRKRSDFSYQIKNVVRSHLLHSYVLEKQVAPINNLLAQLRAHQTTF